ncbi:MAG: alpha/beta fold hydrolase [Syntrophobacterales bacterium]
MILDWHIKEAGRGFPLVLLHGLGASSFSWRENIGPLSQNFQVLAPDLPGHGRTSPTVVADFRLETLTREILRRLDEHGVAQAALVGNSLGGSLALLLAWQCPERFPALVLLAPGVALERLPLIFYPLRLPLLGTALAALLGPWTTRTALHLSYYRRELITPEVVAGYALTFRTLAQRLALRRLACQIDHWPLSRVEALQVLIEAFDNFLDGTLALLERNYHCFFGAIVKELSGELVASRSHSAPHSLFSPVLGKALL